MSVREAIKEVLKQAPSEQDAQFQKQLEQYEEFKRKLDNAGIVQNQKTFSIPLIERIGSSNFSE